MSTPIIITSITGKSWAIAPDGSRKILKKGDVLNENDRLVSDSDAQVQMDIGNNQIISFEGEQSILLSSVINDSFGSTIEEINPEIDNSNNSQRTSQSNQAVIDEGHNFVRVVRISETVEADGMSIPTVARINEVVQPLEMALPIEIESIENIRSEASDRVEETATTTAVENKPVSTVVDNTKTIYEDTVAAGTVLSNSTSSISQFTVDGQVIDLSTNTTAIISGVGTLTFSANGDYTFTPDTGYQGDVPEIEYTVVYTEGTETTGELNITVEPLLDVVLTTSTAAVNEGDLITLTATVENTVEGSAVVVTLNNGSTITIPVGQTSASIHIDSRDEDFYVQGSVSTDYEVTAASGGNEDVNSTSLGSTSTVSVSDVTTAVTAKLTGVTSVDEGSSLIYTVTLYDGNGDEVTAANDVTVTTSQGDITIASGSNSGELTFAVQADDVYSDSEVITNAITAISEDNSGNMGSFESLTYDTSTLSTTVNDTVNAVYAQITVDKTSLLEGGEFTYTVKLVDADGDAVEVPAGSSVTVDLDWSDNTASTSDIGSTSAFPTSVTISGSTSETSFSVLTVTDTDTEYSELLSVEITGVTDVGSSFESLSVSTDTYSVSSSIYDNPTISVIDSNSSVDGDVTIYEAGLNDSADTTEAVSGTIAVTTAEGLDYITIGGQQISLSTLNTLSTDPQTIVIAGHGEVTLTAFTATSQDTNGDDVAWNISFSYTLTDTQENTATNGLDEALTSIDLAVTTVGANSSTGSLGVLVIDDVPTIALDSVFSAVNVTVDETTLGTSSTSVDFSGAFESADFGSDGAATTDSLVYSLTINSAVSTGLTDSVNNEAIVLSVNSAGKIEGRTETSDELAFTVTVNDDGEVTLTQSMALEHSDGTDDNDSLTLPTNAITLVATVTDGDGDTSTSNISISENLSFKDDAPSIGTPENQNVDEANLALGTEPDATALTVTGSLDVTTSADGIDTQFLSTEVARLEALSLTSGSTALSYSLSGDGYTLTASAGSDTVFSVTITDPTTASAGYTYELSSVLDQDTNLTFNFDVTDGDGDTAESSFTITIADDVPAATMSKTVDEDSSVTFNTSADATATNTLIYDSSGNVLTSTTNANDGEDYTSDYGTVTVNSDGTITYTPTSNYSGEDVFIFKTTDGTGTTTSSTVTMVVTPISDAPTLSVDSSIVTTDETSAVSLGLNTPVITDITDQNITADGDDSELLGVITLTGLPDGATLLDGSGNTLATSTGTTNAITIIISDNSQELHTTDVDSSTLTMTSAEFEALQVQPAENSNSDFTVTMSVTSYEVDSSGNTLSGVAGAESSTTVDVSVSAITNDVTLSLSDGDDADSDSLSHTITEDTAFELTDLLTASFDDLDGSEVRTVSVSGLPIGTDVNGTIVTSTTQVVSIDSAGLSTSETNFSNILITPPVDYSGDSTLTITLTSQDADADSGDAAGGEKTSEVTLNLYVTPVGGDIEVETVETDEDTAVNFLEGVSVSDDNDGSEIITVVSFDLPADWAYTTSTVASGSAGATWSESISGSTHTITFTSGTEAEREAVLDGFSILPPAHSSTDVNIDVSVTTEDTSIVNSSSVVSTVTTVETLTVTVNPVAEVVSTDTDDNGTDDLTLTPGRAYTTIGTEDEWFDLGVEGSFDLSVGWSNEDDASESTFASLTPSLVSGDSANGSTFRYSTDNGTTWVEQTYSGTAIEIPVEYLDTLEFKGPENTSGEVTIAVEAVTRDYDEDSTDGTPVEATSGSATLTLTLGPAADINTTTVTANAYGKEDEAIDISIKPSSSDSTETFNVTISDIPDGAIIYYNSVGYTIATASTTDAFEITDAGDGTWSLEITDFDSTLGQAMSIKAPTDSNESFTLTVGTVSVDTLLLSDGTTTYTNESDSTELEINVHPTGVSDAATITVTQNSAVFEESAVDTDGGVLLSEIITSVTLSDTDGSEVLSYTISGLTSGFSVDGATLISSGVWSVTEAQFSTVKITNPDNYNGTVAFTFGSVSTEDDGDSDTLETSVSFEISPSPEATINLATSIDEDVSTLLNFDIVHQNSDTDEEVTSVWIDVTSATDLTLTYAGDTLATSTSSLITVENGWYKITGAAIDSIYAQGGTNVSDDVTLTVQYGITDIDSDGSVDVTTYSDSTDYVVTINAITDSPTLSVTDSGTDDSDGVLDSSDSDLISLTTAGIVTIDLNVSSDDVDGSEEWTSIIISNVPDGVIVNGGELVGSGQWVITKSESIDTTSETASVTLYVTANANNLTNEALTITVITEDSDNESEATDSEIIYLTTLFSGTGSDEEPATISLTENAFDPTEDTAFNLSDVVTAVMNTSSVDSTANNGFTITLSNLPDDTIVTGMSSTTINGKTVWTASGTGDQAALDTLIGNITITTPENYNSTDGDFDYDVNISTYHLSSGNTADETLNVTGITVTAVTDAATITITDPVSSEGDSVVIPISVSNSSDDPDWALVDSLLYIQSGGEIDGTFKDEGGNTLVLQSISGVDGVADGDYYVVTADNNNEANLVFEPTSSYISGSVTITVTAVGQETGAANTESATTSQSITISPLDSGYDFTVADSTGNENDAATKESDGSNLIQIDVTDNGLVDSDGSESITSVLLSGIPDGFLVYVGTTAADAVLATNTGSSWLLSTSAVPTYIGVMATQYWSGTVSDVTLTVNAVEDDLTTAKATDQIFSLIVEAVADGIELTPTDSFGNEGDIIELNLNAAMSDSESIDTVTDADGDTLDDASTETINLEFSGLGEYAAFYVGTDLISDGSISGVTVTYDDTVGTYTLSGLSFAQVEDLGVTQAANDIDSTVTVKAQTEESDGDTSDWTASSTFTITSEEQSATVGDDSLIYTGEAIDAAAGSDTIQLRFEEEVSGDNIAALLSNIETLDLTGLGTNTISSLSAEDVLDVTDSDNVLRIDGDAVDSVSFETSADWTLDSSSAVSGYDVYTAVVNTETVTLEVANAVVID